MARKPLFLLLIGCLLAPVLPSGAALADEKQDDHLARLESLLREQGRQLARLQQELESYRQAHPLQAPAAAPAAAGAPSSPEAAPPPSPRISVPSAALITREPAPQDPSQVRAPLAPVTGSTSRLRRNLGHTLDPAGLGTGSNVRWGGYLTLEYVANSEKNSYFDVHRFVLQVDADITDCFDLTAELEYEHGGIGGGSRDGDVELEHLTATWRIADAFNLKLGAPLIPFGRFNLFHDDPLNDFTKRPLIERYLVPTGFAQPGVGAEGFFQIGRRGVLSYDTLLTSGFDDGFTSSGGVRGARQSWRGDNNENKQLWGRVAYATDARPLDRLEVGVSGTWGRYDDAGSNDITGIAFDWLLRKGPFELQGEYMNYDLERGPLDAPGAVRGQNGLYVQAAYHFFPCAWQGSNSCVVKDTSHFTLAIRYQNLDLDDNVTGAAFNDDLEAWSVGLNYRLTERTVFRVDHTWFDAKREADTREFTFSFSTYF